jgi:hypothetical protein
MKHTIQPTYVDSNNVIRFVPNNLISYIIEKSGLNENDIVIYAQQHKLM